MDVKLLKQIQKKIMEEPRRLNMQKFGSIIGPDLRLGLGEPPCRTTGCIGGWGIFLKHPKLWKDMQKNVGRFEVISIESYRLKSDTEAPARKALKLTKAQAMRLFYLPDWLSGKDENAGYGWPKKFVTAYNKAGTPAARALVTFKRIEFFILTKGTDKLKTKTKKK